MSPELTAQLTAHWPLIVAGLVALVLIIWAIARMSRRAKVVDDDAGAPLVRDVLAEGAAPAARNQALIDAAPAAIATTVAVPAPVLEPLTPQPADPVAQPQAAPAPAPAPAPTPVEGTDDLTRIKGLGPKLATLLGELGVTRFAQIAAWDDSDVARIDAQLGRFAGRITRDQWIAQAKLLATGDERTFAAQFGQNG